MQDSAKKRRAKLLEKGSEKAQKTEVADVDDDAASKKASGKGKGGIWTSEPPLPAGHWKDRTRKEHLSSDSKEPKKPSGRSLKNTRRRSLKSTTTRSCATPSRSTSVVKEPEAMPLRQQNRKKSEQSQPPVAQAQDRTKQDRILRAVRKANPQVRPRIRYQRTRMVLRTWSRLVQQLLKKGLDQSVGRMPIVALELLVCLN